MKRAALVKMTAPKIFVSFFQPLVRFRSIKYQNITFPSQYFDT